MGAFEDSVNSVCRRSERFINVQRLKYNISVVRSDLASKYEELGRYEYAFSRDKNEDIEYRDSVISDIGLLKTRLMKLQKKLNVIKGETECRSCGTANPADAEFCNRCGEKL